MNYLCCRVRRSTICSQDGVIDNKAGDTILDCWASMTDLMSSTDELGGLQLLEVRSTLPDELLLYADKLSDGSRSGLRVPYVDKEMLHKQACHSFLAESVREAAETRV